jgi:hypothetical protein
VNFGEDDWEGFEPDVKDTVNEGDVKVQEKDNGFKKTELERANKGFEKKILGFQVSIYVAMKSRSVLMLALVRTYQRFNLLHLDLRLRHVSRIPSDTTDPPRTPGKNIRRICLRQSEE